jgi:hypothetical protein
MIHEQIIHNLNEIIGNNKASENVYNTFVFAEKAIQNKEIVLEINPKINPEIDIKMTNTILGGMYFRKDKSGIISLVFGQKYLDTYNKNSSIHYTVLIHECKHLYDYFQNKTSFFKSNKKEQFHYELEARKTEVEFIKYYLAGKYNLSKCENYILQSYGSDNLESWTILNRKESADIYRIINDLEIKYKQNTISKEQLANELIQRADQLLEKADQFLNLYDVYNANGNDIFFRFAHYIKVKTFEKYLRFIFNEESEMREILIKFPEFKNRFNRIHFLLNQHDHANNLYSSALDNYFEDDFINGIK